MLLYNLSIWFYVFALRLASPFHAKAKAFIKGRRSILVSLNRFRTQESRDILWFHAASLGEFEQGLPVMERFKRDFPEYALMVTFFSPSGYERRKDHPIADFSCYLPIDTAKNAKKFLSILSPKAAFFIKYEFWFHYLNEAHKLKIPIYSLSARFTPKHIFFKKGANFQRSILKLVAHFFVQNSESQALIQSIGIDSSTLSGDTRFDRVKQTVSNPKAFESIHAFKGNQKLFIVGSGWPDDMGLIADFINHTKDLKIIIAPHEVDTRNIQLITKYLTQPFDLYTQSTEYTTNILVLNTIGMLSDTYQYGDFAYIGGAMGSGLHNILEAVAFGLPVVHGYKGLDKFPEAKELASREGSIIVENKEEAMKALSSFLDQEARDKASSICLRYIEEKAGATDRIMSYFKANGL